MGLIFWGCRRKLVEQFLTRVRDGSHTRTRVTGSCGEVCPLGIDVAGPARRRENLISSVAALLHSFANVAVIVSARPRTFALFGRRATLISFWGKHREAGAGLSCKGKEGTGQIWFAHEC